MKNLFRDVTFLVSKYLSFKPQVNPVQTKHSTGAGTSLTNDL